MFVAAGTTITWLSDYSLAKLGFEICGTSRVCTAWQPRKGSPLGGVLFGSTCTRHNNAVRFNDLVQLCGLLSCESPVLCCAAPTCDDGAPNSDEAGVDCGGSCTACPSMP